MRVGAVAAALLLAGCAAPGSPAPAAASPTLLANAGFEDAPRPGERCAPRWNCTMHSNVDAFRFTLAAADAPAGRQALCIERVKNEPWALATQGLDGAKVRGRRARLTLALRTDREVEGKGAGPWALVHGAQRPLGRFQRLVPRTDGWERLSIEFDVAQEAVILQVGVVMEGGGRVCVDDVRLELLR